MTSSRASGCVIRRVPTRDSGKEGPGAEWTRRRQRAGEDCQHIIVHGESRPRPNVYETGAHTRDTIGPHIQGGSPHAEHHLCTPLVTAGHSPERWPGMGGRAREGPGAHSHGIEYGGAADWPAFMSSAAEAGPSGAAPLPSWMRVSPPQVDAQTCDCSWRDDPRHRVLCSSCALSHARALRRPSISHLVYDHVCPYSHTLM